MSEKIKKLGLKALIKYGIMGISIVTAIAAEYAIGSHGLALVSTAIAIYFARQGFILNVEAKKIADSPIAK